MRNTVSLFFKFNISFIIDFSVSSSNEVVGSSKINNSGFLYKALAIPIRCFSPLKFSSPSRLLFGQYH